MKDKFSQCTLYCPIFENILLFENADTNIINGPIWFAKAMPKVDCFPFENVKFPFVEKRGP